MPDVLIGKGKLAGKGVYAGKDFKKGDTVIHWNLVKIRQSEFNKLPKSEHKFVHTFYGQMYLFPEPSRYTNHSVKPNTTPNFKKMLDVANRNIKKGEMITTNSRTELETELKTFIENLKGVSIQDFKQLSGGYRNALVRFKINDTFSTVKLKRVAGNWRIIR